MAEPFPFELVSPAKLLVSGDVDAVLIPGTEGYFQVFANHAPLMSTIKPGVMEVKMAGGEEQRFVIFGGFADVSPTGCTVLAEHAVSADELDKDDMAKRIEDAKQSVENAKDDQAKTSASDYLDQLTELQASL